MGRKKLGVIRISIKLNLRPGVDDDLIALLLGAPSRSRLVKERLRALPAAQSALVQEGEDPLEINETAPALRLLDQFTF